MLLNDLRKVQRMSMSETLNLLKLDFSELRLSEVKREAQARSP